jgi:hypothetical protein
LVAAAYSAAWWCAPPPLRISELDLNELSPLVLSSGGASLVWRRIRESEIGSSPAAVALHQAYRINMLWARRHELQVQDVFGVLRAAGVEPLLGKGWAIARLYPETGLRPYGDIDICFPPEQRGRAEAALVNPGVTVFPVDLHDQFEELNDRPLDLVHARSSLVPLGNTEVRVVGPEDQLRLACVHFLRHGAWRPLWLCDVGVLLENLPASFDWDYFVSGDSRRTEWALCVVGLAHCLLGARVGNIPTYPQSQQPPPWLTDAVLRQWGIGCSEDHRLMTSFLRRPGDIPAAALRRWPNPIEASVRWRAPFDERPRLPYQLAEYAVRIVHFAGRLARSAIRQ